MQQQSSRSKPWVTLLAIVVASWVTGLVTYSKGKTAGRHEYVEEYKNHIKLADQVIANPPSLDEAKAVEINKDFQSLGAMMHLGIHATKCLNGEQKGCDHLCKVHKSRGFCEVTNARTYDFLEHARGYEVELAKSRMNKEDPCEIANDFLQAIETAKKEVKPEHPHDVMLPSPPPTNPPPDVPPTVPHHAS